MTDSIAELLLRYELGGFSPAVRARLATTFREDPPDAIDLLQRGAGYLGIEGSIVETEERIVLVF